MRKKPTVLMILDGYGLNDRTDGNAVAQAKTPVMDQLTQAVPRFRACSELALCSRRLNKRSPFGQDSVQDFYLRLQIHFLLPHYLFYFYFS